MAQISVLDASGDSQNVELPNANGRAAAAASRPVAISTEDLAAINAITTAITTLSGHVDGLEALATALNGYVDGIEGLLGGTLVVNGSGVTQPVSAASLPLPTGAATSAKQDDTIAAVNALVGTEYETVAASQTTQSIGATGATGDLLVGVLVVPATTSPGAVSIKDGAGSAITVFAGGTDSVSTLHPFFVPLGIKSGAGAWQITTGADVSAIAVGNFT